jgi:hypothetical protein
MRLPSSKTRTLRGQIAFTLTEVMISAATLLIVMGSVIACNLFGLAMAARQQIWMGASDDAAQTVSTLMGDIRAATIMAVGSYSNNLFTQASGSGPQSGNALMICTSTNVPSTPPPWTVSWTLYYYDSVSNNLVRSNYYGLGAPGDFKLVSANPITNDIIHPIFTEVYCTNVNGSNIVTPLSSYTALPAVSVYLSFTAVQNYQIVIGSGSQYDLYQIMATISPRLRL